MAGMHLAIHVVLLLATHKTDFSLHNLGRLLGLIVCQNLHSCIRIKTDQGQGATSVVVILILSSPFIRRVQYEIFLKMHKGLATISIYSIWQHLPSESLLPRLYIYVPLGIFSLTTFIQLTRILYRNGVFSSRPYPRAIITCKKDVKQKRSIANEGEKDIIIKDTNLEIQVTLGRPMKVKAGQYVYLWMPSVSLWSWMQTHPFMVTSWSSVEQDTLELFVNARQGLTRKLRDRAALGGATSFLTFVGGPHGISKSVSQYESVLVVASGFGIAGVISHLRKLLHGYNTSRSRIRRVHLVWQLYDLGRWTPYSRT
jgi:predicted ferric reductase